VILLDTNVVAELMRDAPDESVLHWLDRCPADEVWIPAVSVMELRYGLALLPPGRRRDGLASALDAVLAEELGGRIAVFDQHAAAAAAALMASRRQQGRPVDLADTMIAGTALARRATLATRNLRHFADLAVPVVNPFAANP
jgi:predicted nucleic acid-binding protein